MFANNSARVTQDIARHYQQLDAVFLAFSPELVEHVKQMGVEKL